MCQIPRSLSGIVFASLLASAVLLVIAVPAPAQPAIPPNGSATSVGPQETAGSRSGLQPGSAASAFDYVSSSSPLADGRVVTRLQSVGQSELSRTTISGQPSAAFAPQVRMASQPNASQYNASQYNASNTAVAQAQPNRPYTAYQVPVVPNSPGSAAANTVPSLTPSGQLPATANPNCNCGPNPAILNGQSYPYPAANVGGNGNSNWALPPTTAAGGLTPNTGPQPLLRLRPMPAGAYLGQGIIGQPTAYVHGEPLRNMLRYIMP